MSNETDSAPELKAVPAKRPSTPLVSIVVPMFNEQHGIGSLLELLQEVLSPLDTRYEIVCINDGSSDGTLETLRGWQARLPTLKVIDLSRRFGKEAALTAGLEYSCGDAVVPFDADLQDPAELIPEMIRLWRDGAEVVLARRSDRRSDSFMKRNSARLFYRMHNSISELQIPDDVGDFRLMDRRVVEAVLQLPERCRFMKGIFAWVGFRTTYVDYQRRPRAAGHSKFNSWRLWNFALEGITSFSTWPLRLWTYIGLAIAMASLAYGGYIVFLAVAHGIDVPGYASLATMVLFLGGIQLFGIGILGEYVGRLFQESKQRPLYVVRDFFEGPGANASRRERK